MNRGAQSIRKIHGETAGRSKVGHSQFEVQQGTEISALLLLPPKPKHLLVLSQGDGAGMAHPFMANLANRSPLESQVALRGPAQTIQKRKQHHAKTCGDQ
jgi:hypothetical protein